MSAAFSVFYGPIINPATLTDYAIFPRALLAVDSSGNIAWVEQDVDSCDVQHIVDQRVSELKASLGSHLCVIVTELRDGEFILPGFVDTHTVLLSWGFKFKTQISSLVNLYISDSMIGKYGLILALSTISLASSILQ